MILPHRRSLHAGAVVHDGQRGRAGSVVIVIRLALESRELAMISVRIVSAILEG